MSRRPKSDYWGTDAAVGKLVKAIVMEPPDVVARIARELELDGDPTVGPYAEVTLLKPYTPCDGAVERKAKVG